MKFCKKIKFCIFFALWLLLSPKVLANGWDDFVNFFTGSISRDYYFGNPANRNNPQTNLNSKTDPGIDAGNKHSSWKIIEPPWNREVGRSSPSCLYYFDLGDYVGFTDFTCAQNVPGNSYKNTRIALKNVSCTVFGCWDNSFSLNGILGECNMFPTSELVVARRICARIASPSDDSNPMDPGYTYGMYQLNPNDPSSTVKRGQHLDEYGATQWDDLVNDDEGETFAILAPKICAYQDPWALDLWVIGKGNVPDIFDLDPTHQPFHQSDGTLSPIARIIIFVFQSTMNLVDSGIDIVGLIVSGLTGLFDQNDAKQVTNFFSIISSVVEQFASVIISLLEDIGQVNRVVYASSENGHSKGGLSYGCIEIPLGPYPPPYCHTISIPVSPEAFQICTTDKNGQIVHNMYSKSGGGCVLSDVDNNFIHNSVRVAYPNVIPVCSGQQFNNCVQFTATSDGSGTGLLQRMAAQNSLVDQSETKIYNPTTPPISNSGKYRVVYQVQTAAGSFVSVGPYYYKDLLECPLPTPVSAGYSNMACQKIYGIDAGDYTDSLTIDYSYGSQGSQRQSSTVSLQYTPKPSSSSQAVTPVTAHFYAQIDEDSMPGDITIYQEDTIIDTVQRMPIPDYANYCDSYGNCNIYNCDANGNCSTLTKVCCNGANTNQCNVYSCDPVANTCNTSISQGCDSNCSQCNTVTNNVTYISGLNVFPCTSSYSAQPNVAPCMQVKIKALGQKNAAYVSSASMSLSPFSNNQPPGITTPKVQVAGKNFTGYLTDNLNQLQPFATPATLGGTVSQNSLLGSYIDKLFDLNACDWDTCARYLTGMEYIYGNYVRGASWFCLNDDASYDPQFSSSTNPDLHQGVLAKAIPGRSPATASKALLDRINPAPKTNPNDPTLTYSQYYNNDPLACLNNKKSQPNSPYSSIIQCAADCKNSSSCSLVDASCGQTPIYFYSSSLSASSKKSTPQASASSNSQLTNAVSIVNGYLTFKQSDQSGKVLVENSILLDVATGQVTVFNKITAAVSGVYTYNNSVINPNIQLSSSASPFTTQSSQQGVPSTAPNTVSGSKSIQADDNNLTLSYVDSANPNTTILVWIDTYSGQIRVDKISGNVVYEIAFDPFSNSATSTTTTTSASSITTEQILPASNTKVITIQNSDGSGSSQNIFLSSAVLQSRTATSVSVAGNTTTYNTISYDGSNNVIASSQKSVSTSNGTQTISITNYDSKGVATGPAQTTTSPVGSNGYYCYVQNTSQNDPNQVMRNKVGAERLNRCAAVPKPLKCAAYNSTVNNINWPASDVGTMSQGQCASGYSKIDINENFQAYCLMQYSNGSYPSVLDKALADKFKGCTNAVIQDVKFANIGTTSYITAGPNWSANIGSSSGTFGFSASSWPGGSVQYTFQITFNIFDPSKIALQFAQLAFDDGVRVRVNGRQISNDNAIGNRWYRMWPGGETNGSNSLRSSDFNTLNTNLQQALVSGANTISIDFIVYGGGGITANFSYNTK